MALSRFVLPYADVGAGIRPSSGAKLFFYATGTSTLATTYADSTGDTPNTNPVIANANGVFPAIFLSGIFNVALKDSNDVQTWTADPVSYVVSAPIFATVAAMTAATPQDVDGAGVTFTVGMWVTIVDYATGNNSGVMFGSIVAGSTGTADGGSYIDLANGTQFKQNFNTKWVGVKQFGSAGNDSTDDHPSIQATYTYADTRKVEVVFDSGTYLTTDSINGYNVSTNSSSPTRAAKIHYTGNSYALKHEGSGSESDSPRTRFKIQNIYLSGDSNTDSLGGLLIDRCYIVQVNNVYSTSWNNAASVAVSITNVFNVEWTGGQIANGFPNTQGAESLSLGSRTPDAWNNSNVIFRNMLIQFAGGDAGCKVIQGGNIFDNLTFDNVSFGKNKGWSIFSDSPDVNNITLNNCHFESPGYNGTSTPESGVGHINISNNKCLNMQNNSMQDAQTYFKIGDVESFTIENNKLFETGSYTLASSVAYDISATATRNCVGKIGPNAVRTDQIDTLLNITESGGYVVDLDLFTRKKVDEATWNASVFGNPLNYQGSVVNRFGSTNQPYDQMYTADGVNWGRMVFSTRYKGERATVPSTTETSGSFYTALNATESGSASSKYIVTGWKTTGSGNWFEMRSLTGN